MSIAELLSKVATDYWRGSVGFNPDIEAVHQRLFQAFDETQAVDLLGAWLQRYQPCLFGRIAARLNLITFCILTDADLQGNDDSIRDKIQDARSRWTRQSFEGRKSGFVIAAISPRLANAVPDGTMKQIALRLCSLYLLQDIEPDRIYNDEVFLEKPGSARTTWKWLAGVNVFSANADRRWWQDHRFPGGLAFSVNSVGHMAKSGTLARIMHEMDDLLGGYPEGLATSRIDSLEDALEWAMRTIWGATDTVSGKATELVSLPTNPARLAVLKCPVNLPDFLQKCDYREYKGYYHTDVTVPSEYFLPDVKRPATIRSQRLDFTYLFDSSIDNPAFETMAKGRRVRGSPRFNKGAKGTGTEVPIDSMPRLSRAFLNIDQDHDNRLG